MAKPGCGPVARGHGNCQRFGPQGQCRCPVGAQSRKPNLAALPLLSRSWLAAYAGSIDPDLAGSRRCHSATLVKGWPAPHRRPPIRFCSSARAFDPRFFQTPPCDNALALLWLFTSPRGVEQGTFPPSCQTCSAHQEKTGPELGPFQLTELCALEGELRY
jgi:hypothetical protein